MGGDGSFYEVLNGIFARPDWRDVFQKVPLGIIPSGSGNGLSRYVVHFLRGYMPSSILAIFFQVPNSHPRRIFRWMRPHFFHCQCGTR